VEFHHPYLAEEYVRDATSLPRDCLISEESPIEPSEEDFSGVSSELERVLSLDPTSSGLLTLPLAEALSTQSIVRSTLFFVRFEIDISKSTSCREALKEVFRT